MFTKSRLTLDMEQKANREGVPHSIVREWGRTGVSRAEFEGQVVQARTVQTRVVMEDGTEVFLTPTEVGLFRGLDADGLLVLESPELPGFPYALTACCRATAKGCDGYIGCRACYSEVEEHLGGMAEVAVRPAAAVKA